MYDRFFNDRSFAKDAKMESCYQRQQKGKKYLPTKIYRPSSIIFNNFSLPHCIKILLTMWDFSSPFLTFLIRNQGFFTSKASSLFLPCSSLLPPKILHRYSIVTPSIVHRNDGEAMEQRWTSDGAAAKEKRKQSGSIAASRITFPTLKNKFYMT